MKTITLLFLPILLLSSPAQTNRTFKAFYKAGNEAFDSGNFSEAIVQYREALRLEPKAQRYKLEGTFFANYLPRYRLALSHEKTDIFEAKRWAEESQTASEASIIRKKDKARAQYNADIERIIKAAKDQVAKLDAEYNLKLRDARALLSQKKFTEAKTAFEQLYASNPKRPEATVGLGQVDAEKTNYLRQLELDFKEALLSEKFDTAENTLAKLNEFNAGSLSVSNLKAQLAQAKDRANRTIAQNTPTKEPAADTRENPVVVADSQPKTTPPARETRSAETPPRTQNQSTNSAARKTELREALLATLKPYRRGDPDTALSELKKIDSPLAQNSGSYHWLKGLYLLTSHQYQSEAQEDVVTEAGQAMRKASELMASFNPDPKLYPEFVREFYQKHRQ